jgi:hypothetical protein
MTTPKDGTEEERARHAGEHRAAPTSGGAYLLLDATTAVVLPNSRDDHFDAESNWAGRP